MGRFVYDQKSGLLLPAHNREAQRFVNKKLGFNVGPAFFASSAAAAVGFNPLDVNATGGTLSNNNKTFTNVASGSGAFRSINGKSSGAWFYEAVADSSPGAGSNTVGVRSAAGTLPTSFDHTTNEATVNTGGNTVYVQNNFLSGSGSVSAGDIFQVRCVPGDYVGFWKGTAGTYSFNRGADYTAANPQHMYVIGANGGTKITVTRTQASDVAVVPPGFVPWDETEIVPTGNGLTDSNHASVDLLIHGNLTTNANHCYDHSSAHHAFYGVGDTTVSAAQTKYGTHSLRVPSGVANYFRTKITSRNMSTTSNWTVSGWFRQDTTGDCMNFIFPHASAELYVERYGGVWYVGDTAANPISGVGGTITANTWYFLACVNDNGTLRLYLCDTTSGNTSATQRGSGAISSGFNNTFLRMYVGSRPSAGVGSAGFYATDICFVPGVCEYPSGTSFTVPAAQRGDQ